MADPQGGGGVKKNGKYMTFYSAGFFTEDSTIGLNDLKSLDEIYKYFVSSQNFSNETKRKVLATIKPNSNRKYFKIKKDTFTEEVRKRLIAEYVRVTNHGASDLVLFAITDTNSKNTYLFPEFFELTLHEQMAILFHEAFWIINPRSTYAKVIEVETLFQAHLEEDQSIDSFYEWILSWAPKRDTVQFSLFIDLKRDALKGYVDENNRVSLKKLIGEDYVKCKNEINFNCEELIYARVLDKRVQYPESYFFIFLENAFYQNKFNISLQRNGNYNFKYNDLTSSCAVGLIDYGYIEMDQNIQYSSGYIAITFPSSKDNEFVSSKKKNKIAKKLKRYDSCYRSYAIEF